MATKAASFFSPRRTARDRPWAIAVPATILAGAVLALLTMARPIDHDEGQYVAAAILSWAHLPWRDFDYLQTPLQPLLLAPLAQLAGGHALLALRLANAALTVATLSLLIGAQRRLGASPAMAVATGLLFLTIEPVLFAATTARNDALPLALEAATLALLARLHTRPGARAGWLSFALGLVAMAAAAAKISYLLPFASIMLTGAWQQRRGRTPISPLPFAAGALAVLIPTLLLAGLAPGHALFDVLEFPGRAPAEWYRATGQSWRLTLDGRLITFAKFMMLGPAPALIALCWARRERDDGRPIVAQLDGLIVAGIVAALLPAPVWRQYLVPIMPPLLLRAGLALDGKMPGRAWRLAVAAGTMAGLGVSVWQLGLAAAGGSPLLAAERSAAQAAALVHERAPRGPVVTLSPEAAANAGAPLDARFAAGPFLFRTRDGLGQDGRLIGVSRHSAPTRLGAHPPAAFVLGGATADRDAPLDRMLAHWALTHGYRPASPAGAPLLVLVRDR